MRTLFYFRLIYSLTSLLLLLTSQTALAQMYWNTAAKFDGNSYVAVAPYSDLANLSGSFTVECWFNASSGSKGTLFGNSRFGLLLDSTGSGLVGRMQTNTTTRLRTNTINAFSQNKWYHLACTYDASSGVMKFFINGISDAMVTDTGLGIPKGNISGNDTIYIGTSDYGPFTGMLDDIRIWSRPLTEREIHDHMRIPYLDFLNNPANKDFGKGIVLSVSFEEFSPNFYNDLLFYDGYNNYFNHGAQAYMLGYHPSKTITINPSLDLTNGGYVVMPSNPDIEFSGPVSVEVWIYPLKVPTDSLQLILFKGFDYVIYLNQEGNVVYVFGRSQKISTQIIPSDKWTHLAITCSQNGVGKLYINGKLDVSDEFTPGSNPGKDTLYIGSYKNSVQFKGYIDAVKISNYEKSEKEINDFMFKKVDTRNEPQRPKSTISLDFDYLNNPSTSGGSYYYYEGNAKNSITGASDYTPVAPIAGNFVDSFEEYTIKNSDRRIPQSNTAGYMEDDSLDYPASQTISTVQLFLALNHQFLSDLQIYLQAPSGDSVLIWNRNFGVNQSIGSVITIFDDNAEDDLTNLLYTDFGPYIKPANPINQVFSGKNSKGVWKLKITDLNNGNIGYLYSWGLRINTTTGVKDIADYIPKEYTLEQNYPNPFNPSTVIKYSIPKTTFVNLTVYDLLGRRIKTLINEIIKEGYHEVVMDAAGLPSGIYIYSFNADNRIFTKKMILIK